MNRTCRIENITTANIGAVAQPFAENRFQNFAPKTGLHNLLIGDAGFRLGFGGSENRGSPEWVCGCQIGCPQKLKSPSLSFFTGQAVFVCQGHASCVYPFHAGEVDERAQYRLYRSGADAAHAFGVVCILRQPLVHPVVKGFIGAVVYFHPDKIYFFSSSYWFRRSLH